MSVLTRCRWPDWRCWPEHRQPGPAAGHAGFAQVIRRRQAPQARQVRKRHLRWQEAGDVGQKTGGQHDQAQLHAPIKHACVTQLLSRNDNAFPAARFAHSHHPIPLASARSPASSSRVMTSVRMAEARMTASSRTPINAPSIMPITDGAAIIASSAPLLM